MTEFYSSVIFCCGKFKLNYYIKNIRKVTGHTTTKQHLPRVSEMTHIQEEVKMRLIRPLHGHDF